VFKKDNSNRRRLDDPHATSKWPLGCCEAMAQRQWRSRKMWYHWVDFFHCLCVNLQCRSWFSLSLSLSLSVCPSLSLSLSLLMYTY
jgi:hypothetical protein